MADFDKKALNLQLTLELNDQLTWGDLYRFVDLVRKAGTVEDDEQVSLEFNENQELIGLYAYLSAEDPPAV